MFIKVTVNMLCFMLMRFLLNEWIESLIEAVFLLTHKLLLPRRDKHNTWTQAASALVQKKMKALHAPLDAKSGHPQCLDRMETRAPEQVITSSWSACWEVLFCRKLESLLQISLLDLVWGGMAFHLNDLQITWCCLGFVKLFRTQIS